MQTGIRKVIGIGREVEGRKKDGTRFPLDLRVSEVRQGEKRIFTGIVRDISEQKQAEAALAKQAIDLAQAKERAEEADRVKSAFLATMSHELRTPLNSILGFSGVVLQELAGPLNAEQHKQLGMVQISARHLLDLVNDVLDISKIEAGQLEIRNAPFDLPFSIQKVVGALKSQAAEKGLQISAEVTLPEGRFVGDQRRIEQVMLNLLSNAVKFTEDGSVQLFCRRWNEKLEVAVQDTGIGIEPEDFERLFAAFQQVDSGLARQYEGTGLGLSISKKLIEMMNGEMAVTSTMGKGSRFSFLLPLNQEGEQL